MSSDSTFPVEGNVRRKGKCRWPAASETAMPSSAATMNAKSERAKMPSAKAQENAEVAAAFSIPEIVAPEPIQPTNTFVPG